MCTSQFNPVGVGVSSAEKCRSRAVKMGSTKLATKLATKNITRKSRKGQETKAWLRKAIRRKVIAADEIGRYKTFIDELGPKLNAFIKSTRASALSPPE